MPAPGPVGRNLIANVAHLRQARGLSYRKLSARLDEIGRPIFALGLQRVAAGRRRVDVDELVALAEVLGVTPDVLLSPPETARDAPAVVPAALREARNLATRIEELFAASSDPEAVRALGGYVGRALRRVQIEVEELLEETVHVNRPSAP